MNRLNSAVSKTMVDFPRSAWTDSTGVVGSRAHWNQNGGAFGVEKTEQEDVVLLLKALLELLRIRSSRSWWVM